MEVVEVEKEFPEGEEKERAAKMAAVSSLECGKVTREMKPLQASRWTRF